MSEALALTPRLLAAEIAAAILAAEDITIQPVATPEWPAVDGQVYVRVLSLRQKDQYFDAIRHVEPGSTGDKPSIRVDMEDSGAKLAAAALCDQTGAALFTLADVIRLREKHAAPLQRVIDVASDLNGLSDHAAVTAKNDSARATISGSNIGSLAT